MDESLKWMLKLYDEVSNPAKNISASLKSINVAMGEGKSFTAAFRNTLRETHPQLSSFGAALGGWWTVASGVTGFLSGMVDTVFDVGSAAATAGFQFAKFGLDSLAFKESTLASFELILGSKRAAKEMFAEAADFARVTPFETTDVVTSFKQLLGAGFSKDEAKIAFQGIGDVAAASGFDPTVAPRLTLAFAQIRAAGHLMGQDLHQILNATGSAGIGLADVYKSIAKNMGVSTQDVAQLQAQGAIDSKTAIYSIFEAIKSKTGELGTVMVKQGETIKGLFSTLSSAPSDFFQKMDLDNLPGLSSFKAFIQNLIQVFDVNSPSGKKLGAFLTDIVNDIGGLFQGAAGKSGLDSMTSALDTLLQTAETLWDWVKVGGAAVMGFWDGLKPSLLAILPSLETLFGTTGDGVAPIVRLSEAMGVLVGYMVQLISLPLQVAAAFQSLRTEAFGAGTSASAGFGGGVDSAAMLALGPVAGLANSAIDVWRATQKSHSPSEVFAGLGRDAVMGYQQGLQSGAPGALSAVGSLAGLKPPASSTGGAQAGAGGGMTVPITIHMNVGAGVDAEQLGREVQRILPSAIAAALEGLAHESGMEEPV